MQDPENEAPQKPVPVVELDATAPLAVELIRVVRELPAQKQREILEFAKSLREGQKTS